MNCAPLKAKDCLSKAIASKFKEFPLSPGASPG